MSARHRVAGTAGRRVGSGGVRTADDERCGSGGAEKLSGDQGAPRAGAGGAQAQAALTELEVASAAADAFLTVLAAEESVGAARANVERLQVFADSVRALVQNQLRPGADQSRADAELAMGKNQLSQAIQ